VNDALWTRSAERLVAAEPAAVRAAVLAVVAGTWAGHARTIVDEARLLVHAVDDVWVTWELVTVVDQRGWTLLRVVHDEVDDGGGPPPDLALVLDLVERALIAPVRP
jgi:hypothetical protein